MVFVDYLILAALLEVLLCFGLWLYRKAFPCEGSFKRAFLRDFISSQFALVILLVTLEKAYKYSALWWVGIVGGVAAYVAVNYMLGKVWKEK